MTSRTPEVRATDVTKVYGDGEAPVNALAGVSLEIMPGEFVAVVGPSGSGKSTLLHCIAGLDRPTTGDISVAGQRLGDLDEEALTIFRRRRIGVVFQFFNLLSDLSVEDNIAVPLMLDGMSHAEISKRVHEVIDIVGLRDRAHHLPAELSGGEMQRTAIARALAIRPDLIVADEPTGNLDSASGDRVVSELRRACDDYGRTVLLVTHDLKVAERGDRIVELRDGRIASSKGGDVAAQQ